MVSDWHLHYFRWVIADGEPERNVGDIFESFAVQFWASSPIVRTDARAKSVNSTADYLYRVHGQVVLVSGEACLLDIGIPVMGMRDLLPSGCVEGDYVTGEVGLELTNWRWPLPDEAVANGLKHTWCVNKIIADLTPYIAGPKWRTQIRDSSRIEYREVDSTAAIAATEYILGCSIVRRA